MSAIFARAEDKYVANYIFYASSAKLAPYHDAAMTKKAKKSEVLNAFQKGVVVDYGGKLYNPIEVEVSGTVAKLYLANVSSTNINLVTLTSEVDE